MRKSRKSPCRSTPATAHADFVQVPGKAERRKIKDRTIQEYLEVSDAGNIRSMDQKEDCIRWRKQEILGKLRVPWGGPADAVGDWGRVLQNRFGRHRTSYRNQISLAQLPTNQFIFCFERVQRNLQIL